MSEPQLKMLLDSRAIGGRFLSAAVAAALLIPAAVRADAIDDAAARYNVNADVLRSIAYYESHLNPHAYHRNVNGSVDIGLMQINSIHLSELRSRGISANMLTDPHVNAAVGASLLREHIDQYGPTWQAVGEYHSHAQTLRAQYARAIHDIYVARPWESARHTNTQGQPLSSGVRVDEIDDGA